MAKVEMDLAELKQLEAKIEDLENKVVLKEKEKQEILDKQPMVTVLHKYFKPSYNLKKEVDSIIPSGALPPTGGGIPQVNPNNLDFVAPPMQPPVGTQQPPAAGAGGFLDTLGRWLRTQGGSRPGMYPSSPR